MFSIDQNSHSLWDVLPKLQALARRGQSVTHFVEDIDVAFTALGSAAFGSEAQAGRVASDDLRLARERFHHSGGADWGAALFYSEFLGRLPVDLRDWEPMTGMKTAALARKLGRSVEELFDEFSPSDNWQLVGPSYVGDREHHRVIGDLTVAETAPFIRQIVAKARDDTYRAFPARPSRQRLADWFDRLERQVDGLIARHAEGCLADLYADWLAGDLGGTVAIDRTSRLFGLDGRPTGQASAGQELLETFIAEYDRAAGLYNAAVSETGSKLRPLDTARGELPLFAVGEHAGHLVRTPVYLDGGRLRIDERDFALGAGGRVPRQALAEAGIRCLAGKALLLVIQVRMGDSGQPLAVPYRGSLYMPAAHRLAAGLADAGLLPGPLCPIVRVRFRLLDRLRGIDTPIRLPRHLAAAMGEAEVPAGQVGDCHRDLATEAARRLERLADPDGRAAWQREAYPDLVGEIDVAEARRRGLAAEGKPDPAVIRPLSQRIRELETDLLERTLRQIDRDWQVRELDYWDSRGALRPWALAIGGEEFYNRLLDEAEVYEETATGR